MSKSKTPNLDINNEEAGLADVVANYLPYKGHNTDQLSDRYIIHSDKPYPQFNNIFCKAYAVENNKSPEQKLYGVVFENNIPARITTINYLKKHPIANFVCPLEAEITQISATNSYHLTAVLPFIEGITLSEYVEQHGPLSVNFIADYILIPLVRILQNLETAFINHGSINPNNIYINQSGTRIILGECISEPSGYSQPSIYEPLERAECIPPGKNGYDVSADYYALGMLCLYLVLGKDPTENIPKEDILEKRFLEGSYNAVSGNPFIKSNLKDLIRGLMNDNKYERWKSKQIYDWYDGKKVSIPSPNEHIEATRYIEFNTKHIMSCRALAHELYKNWELSRKFIKEDKIIKWLEKSVINNDLLDNVFRANAISNRNQTVAKSDKDELIVRYIQALDKEGPLRFKDMACQLESLPIILALGYAKDNKQYIENFTKTIRFLLWVNYKDKPLDKRFYFRSGLQGWLDNCVNFIDKKKNGFGIERCLYELNRFFPCQSPLVIKEYINNMPDLLSYIEEKCSSKKVIEIFDLHIASFLMNRLDLDKEPSIIGLSSYPYFAEHKEIITLAIYALAQRESGITNLPNLAEVIFKRLATLFEKIHNKNIKENLEQKLISEAKNGSLILMIKILSDPNYIKKDQEGFKQATLKYIKYENKINHLKDHSKVFDIGYRYGLRLAVIISYTLCTAVFVILLTSSNGI